ncbi:DUF2637 domain-containing protein [Gordonia rhizosphera]|nr:DUF2637 domain-containing protein [Gordonia rhizosphera]
MRGTALLAAVLTVVIATAAFTLSFFALWELATMAGVFPERWAWLLPIVVDAYIIMSTLLLVYSTRRGDSKGRRYHLSMLVLFSTISVLGNGYHALVVGRGELPALVSAAIAVVAPLALLASTHGLIVHLWHAQASTQHEPPAGIDDPTPHATENSTNSTAPPTGKPDKPAPNDTESIRHEAQAIARTETTLDEDDSTTEHWEGDPQQVNVSDIDIDIDITEDDLELARRICGTGRVKHDAQTVAHTLVLDRRGLPRDTTAQIIGVHRSTINRWAELADTVRRTHEDHTRTQDFDTLNQQYQELNSV